MRAWISSAVFRRQYAQVLAAQKDPVGSQRRAFAALRQELGWNERTSLDSFLAETPISHYDDIQPRIARELKVAKKRDLKFVALTSGTTSPISKQIPFNAAMVKIHLDFQLAMGAILERHTDLKLLRDQRLTWGTCPQIDVHPSGASMGYVSGFISTRSPWITRRLSVPSAQTNREGDLPKKTILLGTEARHRDIRLASGVPSYLVNLFESLREQYGVQHLAEIWPNLQTIIYSGTPIGLYRERLEEFVGRPLNYFGAYIATEAPIGYEIPELNGGRPGIFNLNVGSIVFSFRREGCERAVSIAEMREGDEAELLISTPNGIVNYTTGDLVRIHSLKPTLQVELLGRVGQGLNLSTEKTTTRQLEQAFVEAQRTLGERFKHFFVYPSFSRVGRPCYEWVIASDRPVPSLHCEAALDASLGISNPNYAHFRHHMGMIDQPNVSVVGTDFLRRYFHANAERGQFKMKSVFRSKTDFHAFSESLGSLV